MPIVNYANDVKPFDDDSGVTVWTDAEIATQLNAQTAYDIDAATGRQSFAILGWWYQNQDSSWAGTIQAIQDDPAAPGTVTDFINSVWLRVYGAAASSCGTGLIYDWMGSVDPDQLAAQWAGLFTWGNANGHPFTEPAIESFYSSGGGLKYPAKTLPVLKWHLRVSRGTLSKNSQRQSSVWGLNTMPFTISTSHPFTAQTTRPR